MQKGLLTLAVSAALAGCNSELGSEGNTDQESVVAANTPFAYVYRDGEPVFRNADQPQQYYPGARLMVRSALSQEVAEAEILSQQFAGQSYDAKDLSVSNDGKWLLFSARSEQDSSWNLYEYSFESQQLRRIIADDQLAAAGNDTAPVYSDGKIVFSSDRGDSADATLLFVIERDGSDLKAITRGDQQQDVEGVSLGSGEVVFTRRSGNSQNAFVRGDRNELSQPALMQVRVDGEALQPLADSQTINTQQLSALVQGRNGRLMGLAGAQNSRLGGGQIIELYGNQAESTASLMTAGEDDAAIRAVYQELRSRSLTSDNTTQASNEVSTNGWYSAFWPYRDGTSRMLVSWSQCLKNNAGVARLCEAGENLDGVEPRYGVWVFDAAENSRRPVLRAKQDRIYSEIVLGYPNRNGGLGFDEIPPGKPTEPPYEPKDPQGQALTASVTANEDQAIDINLLDADITALEQLTALTIAGVPQGARLQPATELEDGRWQIDLAQLAALQFIPPADSATDLQLTTDATFTEYNLAGSDDDRSQSYQGSIDIQLFAQADQPALTLTQLDSATGEVRVKLAAVLNDSDGSETIKALQISGVPAGSQVLDAEQDGERWLLNNPAASELVISLAAEQRDDFTIAALLTVQDIDADDQQAGADNARPISENSVTVSTLLDISSVVTPEPLGQPLSLSAVSQEDQAFVFAIDSASVRDFAALQQVEISQVPAGVLLSPATDLGNGRWQVSAAQLPQLTLMPALNSGDDLLLLTQATFSADGVTNTHNGQLQLQVTAVADQPQLSLSQLASDQDLVIKLRVAASLQDNDGSESFSSALLSGIPSLARVDGASRSGDGWQLDPAKLGDIVIRLDAQQRQDFSARLRLDNQDIDQDDQPGGDESQRPLSRNSAQASISIVLPELPQEPQGEAVSASLQTNEDQPVALAIDVAALQGAAQLQQVILAGLPQGVALSMGNDLGNGRWQLTPQQLAAAQLAPAAHSGDDFVISTSATYVEENGPGSEDDRSKTYQGEIRVSVHALADTLDLHLQQSALNSDLPHQVGIELSASTADKDGSESLSSVLISQLPAGAVVQNASQQTNGWLLNDAGASHALIDLDPQQRDNFSARVTVVNQDIDSDDQAGGDTSQRPLSTSTASATLAITTADLPNEANGEAINGRYLINEDEVLSFAFDTDAIKGYDQLLQLEISQLPAGATLTPATELSAGTWLVDAVDLAALTLTPVADSGADMQLLTKATFINRNGPGSWDDHQRDYNGRLDVVVHALADTPLLTAVQQPLNAEQPQRIALQVNTAVSDNDGSESVVALELSGVPATAIVEQAELLDGNIWRLTDASSSDVVLQLAADQADNFDLTLTVKNQDVDADDQAGGDESQRPLSRNQAQLSLNVRVQDDSTNPDELALVHLRSVYVLNDQDQSAQGIDQLANPTESPLAQRSERFVRVLAERDEGTLQFDIIGYSPIQPDGSVLFAAPQGVRLALEVVNGYGKALNQMDGNDYRYQNFNRSVVFIRAEQGVVKHFTGLDDDGNPIAQQGDETGVYAGATGQQWPGTSSGLEARRGETMAQTLARYRPDSLLLKRDMSYQNPWINAAADALNITLDQLTTAKPLTAACEQEWQSGCRIEIRYQQHIQPLWEEVERGSDGYRCVDCHDSRGFTELNLLADVQADGKLASYDRLFSDGTPYMYLLHDFSPVSLNSCRRTIHPPLLVQPENDCFTCYAQSLMNPGGAVLSGNFFDLFDNDSNDDHSYFRPTALTAEQRQLHQQLLTPAERRLIAEWLDQGAAR